MRFNLRLMGTISGGRKCCLEASLYASSHPQLMKEAEKVGQAGTWFFAGTTDPVPEGEHMVVEHVEEIGKK